MIRLWAHFLCLGLAVGKLNPKFLEGCGGWTHCLETHEGSEETLVWFEAWNATIQPKLDHLLTVSKDQQEGWSSENGLLLVMTGDSTMIQQFQVLTELVRLRTDYHPVKGPGAERQQHYELSFGGPRNTPGSVTFVFYRLFEVCMLRETNPHIHQAHAVYFGCGLHLLHLWPVQSPPLLKEALTSWTNYEVLLTNRVKGFRKVNPGVKLVYMTTHTIDESKYTGEWLDTLIGYRERDPAYLDACKIKFDQVLPPGSPVRENMVEGCIDTVFGARGVELLNRRGLAAMGAAGVSIVPAHTLVEGQTWATPHEDGRHYPYLVPMELYWFLVTLEGMP